MEEFCEFIVWLGRVGRDEMKIPRMTPTHMKMPTDPNSDDKLLHVTRYIVAHWKKRRQLLPFFFEPVE